MQFARSPEGLISYIERVREETSSKLPCGIANAVHRTITYGLQDLPWNGYGCAAKTWQHRCTRSERPVWSADREKHRYTGLRMLSLISTYGPTASRLSVGFQFSVSPVVVSAAWHNVWRDGTMISGNERGDGIPTWELFVKTVCSRCTYYLLPTRLSCHHRADTLCL